MQHCFVNKYKRVSLFPIEFYSHEVGLYQLRYRLYLCLRGLQRKYIWNDLHFVVDEKVKILHFHDEDKFWWSSILYHSVAYASRNYKLWGYENQNVSLIVMGCKPLFLLIFNRFILLFNWFILLFASPQTLCIK